MLKRLAAALPLFMVMVNTPARAETDTPSPAVPTTSPAQPSTESPSVTPSVSSDPGRAPFESRVVDTPSPKRTFPALGAHLGMALPLVTVSTQTTGIGADFVTVGLTPGVTVHLDEHWAIDFEFIAFNELKNTPAATTFVVDPGILRKWDGFITGLRVATQVGAPTNSGLVPIFVLPFKVSDRAVWFLELDIPLFIRDNGTKAQFSATALFQTGFGF